MSLPSFWAELRTKPLLATTWLPLCVFQSGAFRGSAEVKELSRLSRLNLGRDTDDGLTAHAICSRREVQPVIGHRRGELTVQGHHSAEIQKSHTLGSAERGPVGIHGRDGGV